jgi:hypothetical protein
MLQLFSKPTPRREERVRGRKLRRDNKRTLPIYPLPPPFKNDNPKVYVRPFFIFYGLMFTYKNNKIFFI